MCQLGMARAHDHRQRRQPLRFAKHGQELSAGHLGHHHVEQHETRLHGQALKYRQRLSPVRSLADLVTGTLKRIRDGLSDIPVVVYD